MDEILDLQNAYGSPHTDYDSGSEDGFENLERQRHGDRQSIEGNDEAGPPVCPS